MKKILILGATGMIGSTLFRYLSLDDRYSVFGTCHMSEPEAFLIPSFLNNPLRKLDACKPAALEILVKDISPDIIINCIGIVKQDLRSLDPIHAIEINSLLPHQLDKLCNQLKARLIHISTDCVFNGTRGKYCEQDVTDAVDIYGQSKALGERLNGNSVVIRTSCVGLEMCGSKKGLLEWFLAQQGEVSGYSKAIFSGITTLELGKVVSHYFLGDSNMPGLWHLSSSAIDKFSLLNIFRDLYQKKIKIIVDESLVVDRSLDSSKFRGVTGYKAPDWTTMILEAMAFEKSWIAK